MSIEWSDYFYYDRDSPSFLKWKIDVYTGKNMNRLLVAKGDNAGCTFETNGGIYWRVGLNGKSILVHRVIYYLLNGSIDPKLDIDHIDGDGLNNDIANLRVVRHDTNSRNKCKLKKQWFRYYWSEY